VADIVVAAAGEAAWAEDLADLAVAALAEAVLVEDGNLHLL
jgi:hypothetical protein